MFLCFFIIIINAQIKIVKFNLTSLAQKRGKEEKLITLKTDMLWAKFHTAGMPTYNLELQSFMGTNFLMSKDKRSTVNICQDKEYWN
jgi:hypothetical protein